MSFQLLVNYVLSREALTTRIVDFGLCWLWNVPESSTLERVLVV